MTENAEIAARLRLARKSLGLTQEEFCARAGVERKSYSGWETGYQRISIQGALALRKAYGFSLDWIYCGAMEAMPYGLAGLIAAHQGDETS